MVAVLEAIQQKALAQRRRIILPEGEDERVLKAAQIIAQKGIATPLLLGDKKAMLATAKRLTVATDGIEMLDLVAFSNADELILLLKKIYQAKGKTVDDETLKQQTAHPLYIATLLVKSGRCDGCVAAPATPPLMCYGRHSHCWAVKTISVLFLALF